MERNTLIECVDYFHQNKAFHRLLLLMKEKIESLGRIGGTIRLEGLNDEKEAFTAFSGRILQRIPKHALACRISKVLKAHVPERTDTRTVGDVLLSPLFSKRQRTAVKS